MPALHAVRLGETPPIGEALRPPAPDGEAASSYLDSIHRTLASWADERHRNQLDGGPRRGQPPVLKPDFAANNILVPPSGWHADEIRAAIAREHRHRHFASLRSSRALTQSVFGAMAAFGRLDLLEGVIAECGRPAFFTEHRGWTLAFEHEVDRLGEPRPSSIDVLLSGPDGGPSNASLPKRSSVPAHVLGFGRAAWAIARSGATVATGLRPGGASDAR